MTVAARPTSLGEVVRFLGDDPALVPVAGCTDLMVGDPLERHDVPGVIDLLGVPELKGVRNRDGRLEIGATTTFTEIRRSETVRDRFPILAQAAAVIGGWQIQNRATIGGNIANASPAGDSLPVLLALDAEIVLLGPDGERVLPYDAFHTGYRETALAPGEIVGWVRLPHPPPNCRQAFRKIGTRQAQAISKVVVALVAGLEDGTVRDYRLAAGSVAPVPVRLEAVESMIMGREWTPDLAREAGQTAAAAVEPIDDVRSTAAYRRFALGAVVERMTRDLGA
jgi:CO/xanthine dehydrogenase FAD-binding subunit